MMRKYFLCGGCDEWIRVLFSILYDSTAADATSETMHSQPLLNKKDIREEDITDCDSVTHDFAVHADEYACAPPHRSWIK